MKKIVLSEGKNDTEFLECVISECQADSETLRFDIEDCGTSQLLSQESSMIRRFFEYRNDAEVLVKSEGGKPDLLTASASMMKQLLDYIHEDFGLYILIDLDGGSINDIAEDIDERLGTRSTNSRAELMEIDDPTHHSSLTTKRANFCYKDLEYEVCLIGFESSLETVAGIDKENDSRDTKNGKIEDLAQEEGISDVIIESLF